jgi:uncharacterized membrane protein YkgB
MSKLISKINKNKLLAASIGILYIWFGLLKFFPQLSPADGLAKQTISLITLGFIPEKISIIILAIIEVTIGTLLVFNYQLKKVIVATLIHLSMTFIPVLFFPDISFEAPFVLTLVGQYIMKNIVIICALLFIYPIEVSIKTH